MSKTYNYFAIPFDQVPPSPPYTVWYTGWSPIRPTVGTSSQVSGSGQLPPPFVVGITSGDLPANATLIGTGHRSQCPAPPPFPSPEFTTASDYLASVRHWVESGTDPQTCSYFSIPFAEVPEQPPYLAWFATWSSWRPVVDPGVPAPLAIGATDGTVPPGAKFIIPLLKDPPPPPPVLPAPDTSLASYAAWLSDRGA